MNKAILFLTWNRLDTTQIAFAKIREVQPPRLYIASDGARENVNGEKEKIEKVRQWLVSNVDWDCEVRTRFLEKNSGGCAKGVSGAVTWFFENEKDGIILEDDCVANPSFFRFCEELLDKYKDDKRIWHITGDANYEDPNATESYYFSQIQHCWGWATWADRWQHFKFDMSDYNKKSINWLSRRKEVRCYWKKILCNLQNNTLDSWAGRWALWIVANKGYCINPYKNLVSNIGVDGIHFMGNSPILNRKTFELQKIIHPTKIKFNQKAINYINKHRFKIQKPSKNRETLYLFNFLPLYAIEQKHSKSIHYLLGLIPLFKIKRG